MSYSQTYETHYHVLHIYPSASQAEVKAAYHHLLLTTHPDKQRKSNPSVTTSFDLDRIKDAYKTLSDPDARLQYDIELKRNNLTSTTCTGPRPAQVVSLSDFEVSYGDEDAATWSFPCRCGGVYAITETELEKDLHLIACERCSETIYVGYEAVEDEDGEGTNHDG